MNVLQPANELTLAYEALRAQATGELPAATPRGLAVFLAAGSPAWMKTWTRLAPRPTAPDPLPTERKPLVAMGREVVQLLAEMALGCHRRWTA